jgi:hypothetical protein
MARNGNKPEWVGFSNVPLTKSQKAAAKKLKWSDVEAFLYLVALASEGYKVTISQDMENTAYTIGATGTVENAGMTMTQRHSDIVTACAAHYVAHKQVCNDKWPDPMAPLFDIDW